MKLSVQNLKRLALAALLLMAVVVNTACGGTTYQADGTTNGEYNQTEDQQATVNTDDVIEDMTSDVKDETEAASTQPDSASIETQEASPVEPSETTIPHPTEDTEATQATEAEEIEETTPTTMPGGRPNETPIV